jgi:ribosomal-protein-alanine N-acetyltransferase
MSIIVQTPRLIIREYVAADEEANVDLYKDERVQQHISKRNDEERRQKFRESIQGYETGTGLDRWGIFNKADGDFIGSCKLQTSEDDPARVELGYVLAFKYWGMGIASELARALIDYGFNQKGLTEICACTDPENIASQNVLLKAGLVRDGKVFWHGRGLPFFRIISG